MSITLHEMLQNLFGINSHQRENRTADEVNIAATRVLMADPNRLSFTIVNLSGNAIYIAPSNEVADDRGIYLAPNGGTFICQWDVDFELVSQEWFGTAAIDNSAVYVLENISM